VCSFLCERECVYVLCSKTPCILMRERESEGEKMIECVYMSVRECVCVCMLVPKVSCALLRVCERETARKKERERGRERERVCV